MAVGTWWEVRFGTPEWTIRDMAAGAKKDWFFLVLIVVAAVIVFLNPGKKIVAAANARSLEASRSDYFALAMQEMGKYVRRKSAKQDMKSVWEPLLKSIQIEVARELDLPEDRLKANLLLCKSDETVTVVARSRPGSVVPQDYELLAKTAAATAMAENATSVSSNIKPKQPRPYKSVVATPISNGTKVCGVITVDSPGKKDFKGKEDLLDAILLPYCSLIQVGLDDKIHWKKCPGRFAR